MAQEIKSKVHKKCPKCGEWKSLSDYFADKSKADGRASNCKACRVLANSGNDERKRKMAEYKKENRDELNRKRRERRASGNDSEKIANQRWIEADKKRATELWRKQTKNRRKRSGPGKWEIPKGKKFCRGCEKILKIEFFHEHKKGPSIRCVACTSAKQIERIMQRSRKK